MKKNITIIILLFLTYQGFAQNNSDNWWSEAKFGMFIHWGLYSIPAGIWNGEAVQNDKYLNPFCEHIQWIAKIPNAEYAKLTSQFNPVDFNADKIVKQAKEAGIGYLVFTSKHHDGFAMYHSKVDTFNIVEATPYQKDPLLALSIACKKYEMKLGIYYSLGRDWREPNAAKSSWGNNWDFDENRPYNYQQYLNEKVKPQLKELLTNYGEVAILWFDTPEQTSKTQSQEIYDYVKKLQPEILINTRIGNGVGDFKEMGDNHIPKKGDATLWETPGTMAASWGYSKLDTEEYWKSSRTIIMQLIDIVSKGGNYLLNIGPDELGNIPVESQSRLSDIQDWMKINGEAIVGASKGKYVAPLYGRFTQKDNIHYVHIFERPDNNVVILTIKEENIEKVELLSQNGPQKLAIHPSFGKAIVINLPTDLAYDLPEVVKVTLKN